MKRRSFLVSVAAMAAGLVPSAGMASNRTLTLYKEPQCSCCEIYAQYLRDNGFDVTVIPTTDLVAMSEERGIPADLQGCHLSLIDGYAVGGHVPVNVVERLLADRPPVKAITLPGMPAGGPGMMPGDKTEPYTIYAVNTDGSSFVYATE